ncbi:universal stress protein [Xanthobacter agilis]|uniref:Nucleotide-binding universal stress UspA family protein n=1 Tax=Xanthobacter agilis TaxID=47492 RepID=A0ABU0LFM9_XANAG|nr:universal stress protein [Xanthobacter agilis]MDQ0505877.1 nucleotide-binding universal stress UspA family protein [Xanthobacter agilis]
MLQRILLLLGESSAAESARATAFALARETGATLAGITGIDVTALDLPTLGRAGASALKARVEADLHTQAEALRKRLRAQYEQQCTAHDVTFECLSFEGDPIEALHLAVETRDLVVTGHDAGFHAGAEVPLPDLLSRLLASMPRPILVCGDDRPEGTDVLVAYDSSLPAMRAVQMFALTGIGKGRRVKVVAVDPDQEGAARRAAGAASYLASHGYAAEAAPIASRLDIAEVLRLETERVKPGLLVMGSYGRRGWREMLFGSTTHRLVENPPCPLFIYH